MARKNPFTLIKDAAVETLHDPRAAAAKALEQAKGTVAVGKVLAEQVVERARGGRRQPESAGPAPTQPMSDVPRATEPAPADASTTPTPTPEAPTRPAPTKQAAAKKVPATKPAATSTAKKAPAKKAPAKKASAKKATTPADVAQNIAPHPPAEPPSVPGDKLPSRKKTSTD